MGVLGAIISALVCRQFSWTMIREAAQRSLRLTGMIMWILFGAYCFSAAYHGMASNVHGVLRQRRICTGGLMRGIEKYRPGLFG